MAKKAEITDEVLKSIDVEGFVYEKTEGGDYGYNTVFGVMDNKIKIAFRLPYYSGNNALSQRAAAKEIGDNMEFVRMVATKLAPEGADLVKFYDGGKFLYVCTLGYEVDGNAMEFDIFKQFSHAGSEFVEMNKDEFAQEIKEVSQRYIDNLRALLANNDFKYKKAETLYPARRISREGKMRRVYSVKISGQAYGRDCNFVVTDFEYEDMHSWLPKFLEEFKNGGAGVTDFREMKDIVKASKQISRLESAMYNAHSKFKSGIRSCEKGGCEKYNPDYENSGWVRQNGNEQTLSECKSDCPNLDGVKELFAKALDAQNAYKKYVNEVFLPLISNLFEKIGAKFLNYATGQTYTWKERFQPENIGAIQCLIDNAKWGGEVWCCDIISTGGESALEKMKDLLEVNADPYDNLTNAQTLCRYLALEDGKIVYRPQEEYMKGYDENLVKEWVKTHQIARLTTCYDIFNKPDDKLTANTLLAIYYTFCGDEENAKKYAKIVKDLGGKCRAPFVGDLLPAIEV